MDTSLIELLTTPIVERNNDELAGRLKPDYKVRDGLISQIVSTFNSDMRMLSAFYTPYELADLISESFNKLYSK